MSAASEFAVEFRLCEVDVVVDRHPATRFALVGRHTYLGQRGEDEVLREVIETFAAYAHEFAQEGKPRMVWFSHEDFVLSETLPLGALYDFIRCQEGLASASSPFGSRSTSPAAIPGHFPGCKGLIVPM